MKLGFNEATCMKRSNLKLDLELCEKNGYDYIEIRLDMLGDYLKDHQYSDLKKFFASSHLKPYAFNSIENINFCTPEEWQERLKLFTFACQSANEIENPYIIMVPTMGPEMALKSEQDIFADSVESLNKFADIAKPYGVKLAFEPIGDPRWCVRSLKQCWDIVKHIDRSDIGIALDAFNLFLYSKMTDLDDLDQVPLEKIFVYHIDDCEDLPLGILDHCHRMFPGDGVIPLGRLSDKLKAKGYDQIASLELFRPQYWEMDPADVIRIGAEKTRLFL
jgi:2-keto-myo-inositol isomerase